MRTILHADANGFYASVECLYNPSLRNVPMAVTGDVDQRHGIILVKNEPAKKFNIKTGEAIWQAKQKCPKLVCVPPDYKKYLYFSKRLQKIYMDYSDQVEAFSLDECWLDVTGSLALFGSDEKIADELRQRAKFELGITLSVGVSWNKIYAKLGSDMQKPDATTVINKDNYKQKVWPLPVEELIYVGRSTSRKLRDVAINTIGDLAKADSVFLRKRLHKPGEVLHVFANGWDQTPVRKVGVESVIKTVGNSTTFPRDLENDDDVQMVFTMLSESVAARMREYGFKCTGVAIHVRDNELFTFTRQCKLKRPTFLSSDLIKNAMKLFKANYHWQKPLRSIGVRGIDLVSSDTHIQLTLFDTGEERIQQLEALEITIDDIRRRFGHHKIQRASALIDRQLTSLNPQEDNIIHPVSYFA